ncbi:hypothetical protein [Mucilaginibacter sp. L196]|uniref:hypothetical protein n=1 Tax=Mucilaginibacter sp. L196 TaxID=1641870 RepID=UPI00131D8AFB|nr:hypothetical protein [Mucilaginibacter sp. L196]
MKYLIGIFFLLATTAAFAQQQQQEKPLVQFTGIVHNADSAKIIVPYVNITNAATHKTITASNYEGYFSFVAHEQDTLIFTCVGYATTRVVIPADVKNKSYTIPVMIQPIIINLPTFHVFPWATTDEFKKDFLALKVADDDLEIAKKNVSRTTLMALVATLPRDGQEIQDALYQGLNTSIENSHSLTPNPLLNPLAWGSFINEITQGDKARANANATNYDN